MQITWKVGELIEIMDQRNLPLPHPIIATSRCVRLTSPLWPWTANHGVQAAQDDNSRYQQSKVHPVWFPGGSHALQESAQNIPTRATKHQNDTSLVYPSKKIHSQKPGHFVL